MVYGCGNNVVKIVLFAANFLICLLGAIIFGLGIWAKVDKNFIGNLNELIEKARIEGAATHFEKYQSALWVLIVVGGFIFLVGFLGCCGAACENVCLLSLYFIIVLGLVIVEIAAVVFTIVNKQKFKDDISTVLRQAYKDKPEVFQPIQDTFHCCGVDGTPMQGQVCPEGTAGQGCVEAVWASMEKAELIVILVLVIVLLVEVVALIFSCVLCRAFKERSGYSHY